MGQYYLVLLKKGNKRTTVETRGFKKLMESSYITNALTDYVFNQLYEYGPHRVAWLGDYAYQDDDAFGGLTHEQYMKEYDEAYTKKALKIDLMQDTEINLPEEKLKKMSVINHTKKVFIDLGEYIENARKESQWVINPLALLTACGNGRGGGDYRGINSNMTGSWAFDLIELDATEEVPENYQKFEVSFVER